MSTKGESWSQNRLNLIKQAELRRIESWKQRQIERVVLSPSNAVLSCMLSDEGNENVKK